MANRRLSPTELADATQLLNRIRSDLGCLAATDAALLWALRRKVYKELCYDERGKPAYRRRLKQLKHHDQDGVCAGCRKLLPVRYAILDRLDAMGGYTIENTRLICHDCDIATQEERRYS